MLAELPLALGGLGLFLVGMNMLTEGLRTLAGDRLRSILGRSTDSTVKGAIAGAATTAMVQSSSATTVAAVGFVAAGLMTFQQSLGIILGANIGTTATGWLVALLGFKLNLGTFLMPFILVGALLKMFAPGGWKGFGWSLAGFGILFLGIEGLKDGMVIFGDFLSIDDFPADTFQGRLKLVALGIVITVITQSSSAGVASALAALSVGAINFPQAAALVIGMNVGTTFTAMVATLGGSTAVRRTGSAHLIYNVLTGVLAFGMLYPLGWVPGLSGEGGVSFDPQIALVAFHSAFNIIGVLLVLGVTTQFARLVIWLVPEHESDLARHLDRQLLSDAKAALDVSVATARLIAKDIWHELDGALTGHEIEHREKNTLRRQSALDQTRVFVESISTEGGSLDQDRQFNLIHALDHLARLQHRMTQYDRIRTLRRDPVLREKAADLIALLHGDRDLGDLDQLSARMDALRIDQREFLTAFREKEIRRVGQEHGLPTELARKLDAARWMQRTTYHLWRITERLRQVEAAERRPDDELHKVEDEID